MTFQQSDLFSSIKKGTLYDTIIFNPPYLPADKKDPHPALDGGRKGHETLQRFLEEAPEFLTPEGTILIVFSSLTKKERVDEILRNKILDFELLEKKHVLFEDLYVYKIEKSALLRELNKKKVSCISYFAKGKRGKVFAGMLGGKKVAVKVKNPSSEAVGKIEHEAAMMRRLQGKGLCPKVLLSSKEYLVMEFAQGKFMGDFLEEASSRQGKRVLKDVLKQMFVLDSLGITKEEMHHPYKHIIVASQGPLLVDFERAHHDEQPRNVTQFCQFLISTALRPVLSGKHINIDKGEMIHLARSYKRARMAEKKKMLGRILSLVG